MTTKNKTIASNLARDIDRCKKRIANERDNLRELIDEANAIAEGCDEAISSLESAVDCLSRYL